MTKYPYTISNECVSSMQILRVYLFIEWKRPQHKKQQKPETRS